MSAGVGRFLPDLDPAIVIAVQSFNNQQEFDVQHAFPVCGACLYEDFDSRFKLLRIAEPR